jgi:acetyl esterase/lipase
VIRSVWAMLVAVCIGLAGWASVLAGEIDMEFGQVYAEPESGPLKADVYMPKGEGPYPGVLVVHGGAWYIGTRLQLSTVAQLLAQHGFTAVSIDYRLAPKHKFPAQIEDCKAAVRWMRDEAKRLKVDPERIGGFGYSAGAHLVCLLGATNEDDGLEGTAGKATTSSRLQAVACGGAPCEFRILEPDEGLLKFWLGGTRREQPEQYRLASPAAFASADDPPMFFFHGERDDLVPLASPIHMCRVLQDVGVRSDLYVVPEAGHNRALLDRTALDKSIEFLAEQLKQEDP